MRTANAVSPLERAIRAIGGPSATAQKLGITPQAVGQWKQVPADRVLQVEALSGVSRHDLRPDIYGPAAVAAFAS